MSEIKTIDKLPRKLLVMLAEAFGYKAWDKDMNLSGVTEETTDWELADFISRSI